MLKSVQSKILVSHLIVAAVVALAAGLSGYYLLHKSYLLLIVGIILVVVAWGSRTLALNITRPLVRLASASYAVANGKLSRITDAGAKDSETISLVESFNKMADNLSSILISRDYVENIFQSISDAIVIVDEDGFIKTTNSATLDLLGYSREELIGRNAGILFGEESGEGDIRKMRYQLTNNKQMESFLTNYLTKSQGRISVILSGSILTNQEGTEYDLVIAGKDISERKRQEEELQSIVVKLEQSNRELQDFAHIASHDLQEPLRKIMAFGDRLSTKYTDALDDQGRDYLQRMRNASVRMQSLIQDLLMYSRITTKARPFAPVDLAVVAGEVLSDLEVRIMETGGRVVLADELPVVNADPLQMRQLLQNLIGNALKFSREAVTPVVVISCSPANSNGNGTTNDAPGSAMYQIAIEDNGIGFDEQYIDKIFGVFQRLHGRNEYEGSGIGLSICRKIVSRHGGHITAKSSPGEGAKFIITLPVPEETQAAEYHGGAGTAVLQKIVKPAETS